MFQSFEHWAALLKYASTRKSISSLNIWFSETWIKRNQLLDSRESISFFIKCLKSFLKTLLLLLVVHMCKFESLKVKIII